MTKEEIMKILPHRDDMLLLDEAESCDGVATGRYFVRGDEFFLGVILCEIMAQSACVLLQDIMTDNRLAVYTGLNNVKFRSLVHPGDTIVTTCSIKRAKHPFYFAEGVVTVDGRICASAEFSFAVTGE